MKQKRRDLDHATPLPARDVEERGKKSKFYRLSYLYRWKVLRKFSRNEEDEAVFREMEKLIYKAGLHSKMVVEDDQFVLYVRESEYEYAKSLAEGAVTAVYGKSVPEYILFKDDFEYKNEKFYQDHSQSRRMRINARMSMFIMAIVIIISMMIVYYVTR
ncbi:MAG: hypothetical protein Q4A41_01490 [Bacillota bacterium]|nr:hypothetical protein [Bacillota bacterium]